MAALRTPQLRTHKRGCFFCRWGGKDHYFTVDRSESEELYARSLQDWHRWRQRGSQASAPRGRSLTVARAFALFIEASEPDVDPKTLAYYEHHLSRFVNLWGRAPLARLGPHELQALKTDLKRMGYADRTVNHELIAVKRLFNWAADMQYIAPVSFRGVRRIPLEPPPSRALSLPEIRLLIATALHGRWRPPAPPAPELPGWRCDLAKRDDPKQQWELEGQARNPQLAAWLELQYLAALRPSEVVRLVAGHGKFVEPGIFRLEKSKTSRRSQQPRHLVLSERALRVLASCRPMWGRPDGYSSAFARVCGPGGPHALRHSAATHLLRSGAARADIDLILGHMPPRVSLTYAPVAWQPLRETAGRLSL